MERMFVFKEVNSVGRKASARFTEGETATVNAFNIHCCTFKIVDFINNNIVFTLSYLLLYSVFNVQQ